MPAGDAFTAMQRQEIAKAVNDAERVSGRTFSVHVGPSEGDPRGFAERLHSSLTDPAPMTGTTPAAANCCENMRMVPSLNPLKTSGVSIGFSRLAYPEIGWPG
ncbi:MAG: hypothetical protein ABJA81_07505 [Nocardioidaceae bacterium]